jgi:hypothetical protein
MQVYLGLTTFLNSTVYMVADAVATGIVEANNSKHSPLSGVTVSAVARDQSQICSPSGSTSSSGKFTIALCPLPSTITFTPPYGYLSTFRYANATPGEQVNLGIIYLETEPPVKVTLYNAVTHAPIPTNVCNAFQPIQCNAIKVCSSATNVCLNQGPALGSATVTALAPEGFDYINAEATNYITNDVPIGWVNHSMTAPPIYLMPLGVIGLSVQVTHNSTPYKWATGLWTASACSMNGYTAGAATINPATYTVNVTSTQCMGACGTINPAFQQLGGFPLRNDVNIAPDTTGVCGPVPMWPIPGDLPVWANESYANVTSNAQTNMYLNLTPGNYVYGNATIQPGNKPAAGGITALGTSQDNPTLQSYGYNNILDPW